MTDTRTRMGVRVAMMLACGSLAAQTVANPAKPAVVETRADAIPWSIAATGARLKLDDGAATAATEDTQVAKPGKGTSEGLKVHGHWTIDVKNPDGTVAQHRDFENALQGSGADFLLSLMAGYVVPGDYYVAIYGVTNNSPCSSGSSNGCIMVRSLSTTPGNNICQYYFCMVNLTYNYTLDPFNPSSLVMSGYVMAENAGTVGYVQTGFGGCPYYGTTKATTTPAACSTSTAITGNAILTGTPLASPITGINAGQIIQVTVTISFS